MSRKTLMLLAMVCCLSVVCVAVGIAQPMENASKQSERLLNVGTLQPDAVKITVWTNVPEGQKFKAGDRVIINFKAEKDCYVTVLNVSAQGDVLILFPSKEHPDNFVKAGKEYSLFGDDSHVRLEVEKGLPEMKIVFYATSEPVSTEALKLPANLNFLRIGHEDANAVNLIVESIEKLSKKPGFNRVILPIKSETTGSPSFKLMGPAPRRSPADAADSERPETLTGTQGVKPDQKR